MGWPCSVFNIFYTPTRRKTTSICHIRVYEVCVQSNGWPSLDNRTMRRKLTIKICHARRGLKKTPHLETNNEVAGFVESVCSLL
ncbi:hypothetical protein NDU88_006442 [Pleurodeles waltl]|uniref:Uncharacterized protein n=1 Tax=Pleurodeles waltl TaxID=8319 RepID=A0AAV7RN23_PLEWA|nr:hypothetical protein NDU88_006442 [Pleurodeles waltl]